MVCNLIRGVALSFHSVCVPSGRGAATLSSPTVKIALLYWLRNATFEVSAGGGTGTLRLLGSRPGSRSPVHTVRLHTSCSIPELNEGGKSFVQEKKRRESTPFVSQDLLQKKKINETYWRRRNCVSSDYDWSHPNKRLYSRIIRDMVPASDLQLMWKDVAWKSELQLKWIKVWLFFFLHWHKSTN